jgi:hypothetical protein
MIPVDRIRDLAKEKGYGFNHYKHPLDEPTKVVLVGERHAVHPDYTFQGGLIELLEPETVMHEFYEPNGTPSNSETVRIAVDWINRWKGEYGVDLKSCDLPNGKIRQFHQMFYDFLGDLPEFNDESDPDSIIVDDNAIREMVMGKLIRAEVARTDKPLIAIVGGYHARPESRIHEELRAQRAIEIGGRMPIGYVTVNQDERLNYILQDGAKFFE